MNAASTRANAAPDPDDIRMGLSVLLEPGVYELRVPKAGRFQTVSGYFDDLAALAETAAEWNGQAAGIYMTLNPVVPALLARCVNRAKPYAKVTTSDLDVVQRKRLLVDLDPDRPTEIASTATEHEAALERARLIREALHDAGWPEPILMDSGNGAYLVFGLDLPNNDASHKLVTGALGGIAHLFGDGALTHAVCDPPRIVVDTTVGNAARIARVPGTLNAKGDDTPDRPYRRAVILETPECLIPVVPELLALVAGMAPTPEDEAPRTNGSGFDLAGFMARHGLEVRREKSWRGARLLELVRCPFNPEHTGGCAAIVEHPDGRLGYRCHHDSCTGRGWRALRKHLEPDAYRAAQEDGERNYRVKGVYVVPPTSSRWPEPMAPEAFHGLAGDFVGLVEPHTEADPAALLVQFLVMAGNVFGRSRYFAVEEDRHTTNLSVAIVGESSKARKGTSKGRTLARFLAVDPTWADERVQSGLSSGEGVIWAVRDPITKREPIREKGRIVGHQEVEADPGVSDKRLLVFEPEFASVLRVIAREGSTLSAVIRDAWDRGHLRSLTKNSPAKASGAHVSIIGHVTAEELRRELTLTDAASGFGNRFLWVCAKRSKLLPEGGQIHEVDFGPLHRNLAAAVDFARIHGELKRDRETRERWRAVYADLSAAQPGLFGALTSRAEAQAVRLSLVYALLDRSGTIQPPHLEAALAVWRYAEASAACIFGDALGHPVADEILRALRTAGDAGMTRTEIRDHFGRNLRSDEIGNALEQLVTHQRAFTANEVRQGGSGQGRGRPVERWFAARSGGYAKNDKNAESRPRGYAEARTA